jgi:hypothetical protein
MFLQATSSEAKTRPSDNIKVTPTSNHSNYFCLLLQTIVNYVTLQPRVLFVFTALSYSKLRIVITKTVARRRTTRY